MTRRGFTLLESVVALLVITTVATAALQAYAAEANAVRRARLLAPALAIARERLARVDVAGADALRAMPDSLARGAIDAGGISYEWRVTREPVRGELDLYTVRASVRWLDDSVALMTRLYRPLTTTSAGR